MIPTKEDWKEAWRGLDEKYAFDHFYGKTLEEAENMIAELSGYYCEDFLWMPEIPFHFYFKSYKAYLISSRSKHDFSAAISFISLIKHCLEYDFGQIKDDWESISYILKKIAKKPDFYGCNLEGGFQKDVNRIIEKWNKKS